MGTQISTNLLVGVALHELTHAMGRVPSEGPFDLLRYTSAGNHLFTSGNTAVPAYFSIDGGIAKLADFGQTSDPSDFLNSGVQGANDSFNEFYTSNTLQSLTSVDKVLLDVLGFNTGLPNILIDQSTIVADFNGDHKIDIFQLNGQDAYVGLSTGSSFGGKTFWGSGFTSADKAVDLNGDGKADMIQFYNGREIVALSSGSSFGAWTDWQSGATASDKLDDVNGDGKADLVQFYNGREVVALSSGSSFGAWTDWQSGATASDKLVDVNGDGKADLVQFYNGRDVVALSSGSSFGAWTDWQSGATASDKLVDVNGDGKADLVQLYNGREVVALSSGSSFGAWTDWQSGATASDKLVDVNGDGKADLVQFYNGREVVALSSGSSFDAWTDWQSGATASDKLVDVNGDGKTDLLRFDNGNAYAALSNGSSFGAWTLWGTPSATDGSSGGPSNVTPVSVDVIGASNVIAAAHTNDLSSHDGNATAGGSGNGNGVTSTISVLAPAGVAGDPINLALADPSADHIGPVTVTIADVPSGWTLNGGTLLDDGTWTVQTNDIAALSITSPDSYTGALVLNVAEGWTNADGSTGRAIVSDNVEVFAKGAPIFAWSGDDTLTGSNGDDLFVFSQPIGNDTIHTFDAAHDTIDLIGYAGFTSFADVQAHLANDAAGDAVLTIGNGQSIALAGVDAGALTASDFVFGQTPVTNNTGSMAVSDGVMLPLSGIVNNTGTIALNSAGDTTEIELIQNGITLQGHGQLTLSDNSANAIFGTDPSVTFTNVDNTISGAGQLGEGQMTLINEATIIANGTNALVIDTGANVVSNSGVLEATGSGGLIIHSDVANSGLLWANGGNITIDGAVTGNGSADIEGQATLEFGAASSENTIFGQGAVGTLILDHADNFTGQIYGFTGDGTLSGSDQIDLKGIDYTSGSFTDSYSNGILTVSDGTHAANLHFFGTYSLGNFKFVSDGQGGTIVYDPPTDALSEPMPASTNQNTAADGAQISGTTITATSANQTLTGTDSNDTFVFTSGFGHDTITNFQPTADVIQIDHSVFADVQALLAATQDNGHGNAVITADQNDSITLTNVTVAQLQAHQSDFHIT